MEKRRLSFMTDFMPGDKVLIKTINKEAEVTGLIVTPLGYTVRAEYGVDESIREVYLYPFQLQLLEEVKQESEV